MLLRLFFASIQESKPQTIDSGSSHYSTLFKEHPAIKDYNVHTLTPDAYTSMRKSQRLSSESLYRDGSPDSSSESSGFRPPSAEPQKREPLESGRRINIASILCLSMLFSKISRIFSRTPLRRTLPQRSLTVHLRAFSMITPARSKVASESSG